VEGVFLGGPVPTVDAMGRALPHGEARHGCPVRLGLPAVGDGFQHLSLARARSNRCFRANRSPVSVEWLLRGKAAVGRDPCAIGRRSRDFADENRFSFVVSTGDFL